METEEGLSAEPDRGEKKGAREGGSGGESYRQKESGRETKTDR